MTRKIILSLTLIYSLLLMLAFAMTATTQRASGNEPTGGGLAVAQKRKPKPSQTPVEEGASCKLEKCKVKEVIINTGYDHPAGTTYTPVQPDGYWELVDAPNTALTIPTAAWVINKINAWQILPNSQWISPYQQAAWNLNNRAPNKPYSFQRCFCTCEKVSALDIKMQMLVDNIADVYFDNALIGQQTDETVGSFNTPLTIEHQVDVKPGKHCLRIDVRNLSDVAMGLNVAGTITDQKGGALFLAPACCNPTGKIMGRKINDANCNGRQDTNETGLSGWTITAVNTGTGATVSAVTDANGFYYFNNLPAGTYTISETLQSGWTQSIPGGGGTYTVTLAAGQVIERNFGNCKKGDRECATIAARDAVCKKDGSGYTYTFTVTNNSGKDVDQILLTPQVGSGITLSDQVFEVAPFKNGDFKTLTVEIGNVIPGTSPCFFVTLMTKDGPCCTVKVCPVFPDCCATASGKFECTPRGSYTGTFTIINTSPNTIKNIYIHPPSGVTLSQSYFAVSVGQGGSFTTPPITITVTGARPERLCFRVSMHEEDMKTCCVAEVCIDLPNCKGAIGAATFSTGGGGGSSGRTSLTPKRR